MATLIPSIGACVSRMTPGERRFAQRVEEKLEDDYLCWYDVAVSERTLHPDFVLFHPRRGILVLEVKDWKVDTILGMDPNHATLHTSAGRKQVANPLEQARQYAFVIASKLERDPQLTWASGKLQGKLICPYGYGVVLSGISRKQFDSTDLREVLPCHRVICQDEMTEGVDPGAFQERLWAMLPFRQLQSLSLPQIDRIRWHMFPEIRVGAQQDLFRDDGGEVQIPDVVRVMDIQQEQLARSLGEGHRVIHGVAGSGKTLILGYRAEHLAKMCQRPILILCYNKTLAAKLTSVIASKGLSGKVVVQSFHAWCVRQLDAYHVLKPARQANTDVFFAECVDRVIRGVDHGLIPAAQYDAVMIDEGHDFRPEWLKLVVQMVHPDSNSLLLLYDDAQSIYGAGKRPKFSFSSVGIQAKGRTTVLKLNYRNTAEILAVARAFADHLLDPAEVEEDQAPTVQPMSAGRHGPRPQLIRLPSLRDEAHAIAQRLADAHKLGVPWKDMAVIYRRFAIGKRIEEALARRLVPHQFLQGTRDRFAPDDDRVKIITLHSSKGLEFPLVCIPGLGGGGAGESDIAAEARLVYVGMTRATNELLITYSEPSMLSEKMEKAMSTAALA